jgi:ADP-ribose pyrophosphatase
MSSREQRSRYSQIKEKWPELFVNRPDASYRILDSPELVAEAEATEEENLRGRGMPAAWSLTGVAYEDPYLIVLRDAVRRPDGSMGTYVRTMPASGFAGVAVLPLCRGKIVLLRHFRHATRNWHLEIPRGYGEAGVSATDQAAQELREEIEADITSLVHLGPFHSNTGTATDQVELFLAEISTPGAPQQAEGISDIEFRTPYQVAQLIRGDAGTGPLAPITDSFTIGAFTRAWLRGLLPGLPAPHEPGNSSGAEDGPSR